MPYVTINLLQGHSKEKKERLHKEVAEAIQRSLEIPIDWIRIQLIEMTPTDNSIGGITIENLPKK